MANTQSEADRLFAIIDTNKNGRIEDSELLTYLLAQGQEEDVRIARYPPPAARCAPRGFPALAAARSCDHSELSVRAARWQSISDLFKCLDLDGKGHISREDFRSPNLPHARWPPLAARLHA